MPKQRVEIVICTSDDSSISQKEYVASSSNDNKKAGEKEEEIMSRQDSNVPSSPLVPHKTQNANSQKEEEETEQTSRAAATKKDQSNEEDHQQEEEEEKKQLTKDSELFHHRQQFLRPYKKLDSRPILKRLNLLKKLIQSLVESGEFPTDEEKKQIVDHVDQLRYIAVAEHHFPTHPSILCSPETDAVRYISTEMLGNPRYGIVFPALDFLAIATRHPQCAEEVMLACEEYFQKFPEKEPKFDSQQEEEKEKHHSHHPHHHAATPGTKTLDWIAKVMFKFKNKTEIQICALDLLHNLVFVRHHEYSALSEQETEQEHEERLKKQDRVFVFHTADILRSEAMTGALRCVRPSVSSENENPHDKNLEVASRVVKVLMELIQRPALELASPVSSSSSPSSSSTSAFAKRQSAEASSATSSAAAASSLSSLEESPVHKLPESAVPTTQQGPTVADVFANVGDVLPTLIRLANLFPTRPSVIGGCCRIFSHMTINSGEELVSTAVPSILSRTLKAFADGAHPLITLDCIRALSQLAPHFMPLQIESLVMTLRVVMTSTGNVMILTTCIASLLHLLRMAENNLDVEIRRHIKEQEENEEKEKEKGGKQVENKQQQKQHHHQQHNCLEATPEEEQIHHAKKNMRSLLELMQKESVPFVGAAYDHFADESVDLKVVADAYLKTLGNRIRKQFYSESSGLF